MQIWRDDAPFLCENKRYGALVPVCRSLPPVWRAWKKLKSAKFPQLLPHRRIIRPIEQRNPMLIYRYAQKYLPRRIQLVDIIEGVQHRADP